MTINTGHIRAVSAWEVARAVTVTVCRPPATAAVTGRALTRVMRAGLIATMAALTIGLARVAEVDAAGPTGCAAMAGRTLPSVVVAGFVATVAALAIGLSSCG